MMLPPTTHTPGRTAVGLAAVNLALPDEAATTELTSFCDVLLRSLATSETSAPALQTRSAVATATRRPQATEAVDPADAGAALAASLLTPQTVIAPAAAKAGASLLEGPANANNGTAGMAAADSLAREPQAGRYELSTDHASLTPVLLNTRQAPGLTLPRLASTIKASADSIEPEQLAAPTAHTTPADLLQTAPADLIQTAPEGHHELHNELHSVNFQPEVTAPALPPAELTLMSVSTGSRETRFIQGPATAGLAPAEPRSAPVRLGPDDAPHAKPLTDDTVQSQPDRVALAATRASLTSDNAVTLRSPALPAHDAAPALPGRDAAHAVPTPDASPTLPSRDRSPALRAPDPLPATSLNPMTADASLSPASAAIIRSTQRPANVGDTARPSRSDVQTDVNSGAGQEAAIQADPGVRPVAATRLTATPRSPAAESARQPVPAMAGLALHIKQPEPPPVTPLNLESTEHDAISTGATPTPQPQGNPDSTGAASATFTTPTVPLHHANPPMIDNSPLHLSRNVADTPVSYASLSAPLGSEGWDKALSQQVLRLHSSGHQVTELELSPPGLGPLKITLDLNDRQMQLTFVSEHASVRAAVEAAVPELRSSLAHSGISLGSTSVNSDRPPPSTFGQPQGHASGQRGYPREGAPDRSSDPVRAHTASARPRHGDSIDTYA